MIQILTCIISEIFSIGITIYCGSLCLDVMKFNDLWMDIWFWFDFCLCIGVFGLCQVMVYELIKDYKTK